MQELSYKEKSEVSFWLLKESIKEGRISEFEVVSESMAPLLRKSDKVLIKCVSLDELKKGDVIVYKKNDHLCVHRYINKLQKDKSYFKLATKGDNIFCFDPWLVSEEEILGKVIRIKKKYGEINLESLLWRINNYLIARVSHFQVSIIEFCKLVRKHLLGNKKIFFMPRMRKTIFLSLSTFLRYIVNTLILASRLIHPKNTKTTIK